VIENMSEIDSELRDEVEEQLGGDLEWLELEDGLNTVYLLSGDQEFILKVRTNPENKPEWFRAEPRIYEKIRRETEIPSPKIIYEDFSKLKYENEFFIMEKMEGQNPQDMKNELDQEKLEDIMRQYGNILGKLHQVQVSQKYGIQGFEKGEFTSSEPNEKWNEAIEGAMSAWQDIISDEWENPPEINYNSEKVKEILPEKPKAVLVHSDNRLDNILLTETKLTGFIDWSTSWTGHAFYDFVRAKYLLIEWDLDHWGKDFDEKELKKELQEGYKHQKQFEKFPEDERIENVYRYASTLWLAAGFANWGQQLDKDEHAEMRDEIVERINQEQKEFLT